METKSNEFGLLSEENQKNVEKLYTQEKLDSFVLLKRALSEYLETYMKSEDHTSDKKMTPITILLGNEAIETYKEKLTKEMYLKLCGADSFTELVLHCLFYSNNLQEFILLLERSVKTFANTSKLETMLSLLLD